MNTTADTAELLRLKKKIETLTLGEQLILAGQLLMQAKNPDLAETIAGNVVDLLRAKRILGR